MTTILIVDDDQPLATLTQDALSNYVTIWASDGAAALHLVAVEPLDLVLLDLRLPDVDGLQLVGMIRKTSTVPIIIISGRSERVDRVLALQTGADDFVAKPFDIDDLEARIEAVLRRSKRPPVPVLLASHQVGALTISAKQAFIAGVPVYFTLTEHRILLMLAERADERADEPVTLAELSEGVWGDNLASSGLIHTNIGRVRSRLREHPEAPLIETWRKRGVVLRTGKAGNTS